MNKIMRFVRFSNYDFDILKNHNLQSFSKDLLWKTKSFTIFKLKKMIRERGKTFMNDAFGVSNEDLGQDLEKEKIIFTNW